MDINKIITPTGKKPKDLLSLFLGRITKPKAGEEPLTVPVWKTLLGKGLDPLAYKRWFVKFRPYETIQIGAAYARSSRASGIPISEIHPPTEAGYVPTPQGEKVVPTGVAGGVITPPTIPSPIREITEMIARGPSGYAQPSPTTVGARAPTASAIAAKEAKLAGATTPTPTYVHGVKPGEPMPK